MPPMTMVHDVDPAVALMKQVGDLRQIELYANQVLLAVYVRPEKTKSGLYLADQTRKEDEFQGKAMLVLKKGPAAFVSDENYDFHGQDVKPGDWVVCWVSDGRKIMINGQLCRVVQDQHIRMRISAPDVVY